MIQHSGTQPIVGQMEGSNGETVGFSLEADEGLLKCNCYYPTDNEIATLPRVWLTSSEKSWDPAVLDNDSVTIPSYYQAKKQVHQPHPYICLLPNQPEQDSMEQLLEMDHFAKRVARQNVLVQAL